MVLKTKHPEPHPYPALPPPYLYILRAVDGFTRDHRRTGDLAVPATEPSRSSPILGPGTCQSYDITERERHRDGRNQRRLAGLGLPRGRYATELWGWNHPARMIKGILESHRTTRTTECCKAVGESLVADLDRIS